MQLRLMRLEGKAEAQANCLQLPRAVVADHSLHQLLLLHLNKEWQQCHQDSQLEIMRSQRTWMTTRKLLWASVAVAGPVSLT